MYLLSKHFLYIISLTQDAYVMARAYISSLFTLKECACGLVYSRNSTDFLGFFVQYTISVFCLPKGLLQLFLQKSWTKDFLSHNLNFVDSFLSWKKNSIDWFSLV